MTSLPRVLFLCLTLGFISTQTSICQTETGGGESRCFDPIDKLQEIKNDLELNGFVLIPGPTMRSLMKNFGATDDDLALMESSYFHERLPPVLQPVMKHRKNAFHRVLIDQGTRVNKSCRQ